MKAEDLIKAGEGAEKLLQFEQATFLYQQAIPSKNHTALAARKLAALRLKTGDPLESIQFSQIGIQANPADYLLASSLIYALQCVSECSPEQIFQAHLNWTQTYTTGLGQFQTHPRSHRWDWKKRIGFISPDFFGTHPVLKFFESIWTHLDQSRFEVFLYSCCENPDQTTDRYRRTSPNWREFSPYNLPQATAKIWDDQLDLLIDLAGHSSNHTLLVLATQPARKQATYLGYPNTTGLKQVQYRLVDAWSDPVGMTDKWHTEQLIRLPQSAWCFSPPSYSPTNFIPNLDRTGHVTLGCFNALPKLSSETWSMWKQILETLPQARLMLKADAFHEELGRSRWQEKLRQMGLPVDRISLRPSVSYEDHLKCYREIDVALDTYPYHGTTTTCEALWMGVPVVTRVGNTHISRVGASLLQQVNLQELITHNAEEYISAVVHLASEKNRIRQYHASLRNRMSSSILTNPKQFLPDFENMLDEMTL